MPTLILRLKSRRLGEFTLEHGGTLTVGRRRDNDIVLNHPAVSGRHAKIDSVGGRCILTDLQSKNGTLVNRQKVTSRWLKHADYIQIGKHTLVFGYSKDETPPEEDPDALEQTMIMDADRFQSEMMTEKSEEEAPGMLAFMSGAGGELSLAKRTTTIGKDPDADVPVSGFGIGRTAAVISRRDDGYHLRHTGGLARPRVNGHRIKHSVLLNEFDVIEIGVTRMQFWTRR